MGGGWALAWSRGRQKKCEHWPSLIEHIVCSVQSIIERGGKLISNFLFYDQACWTSRCTIMAEISGSLSSSTMPKVSEIPNKNRVAFNPLHYTKDFCKGNFRIFVRIKNSIAIFTRKCQFESSPLRRLRRRFSFIEFSKLLTWSLTLQSTDRR